MMEDLLKDNVEHGYEDYTENFEKEKKSCCGQEGSGGGCCRDKRESGILLKKEV